MRLAAAIWKLRVEVPMFQHADGTSEGQQQED